MQGDMAECISTSAPSLQTNLQSWLKNPLLRALWARVGASLVILLSIVYLTLFGLIMADRGRAGLPAEPTSAALEALQQTTSYVIHHPATYFWQAHNTSVLDVIATAFYRSAGLLLVSLGLAALLGIPLGIIVTLSRRVRAAPLILILSVLGISTPSFLLAMFLWVVNIQLYQRFGNTALPPTGFGWDAHLIMPALVLAARPFAQIAQITYVSMSDVLGQDYIRTAQSKGLRARMILGRHALRNAWVPILTTLGTSLRFSLASLPVVEFFFVWPGVGLALLQAIQLGMDTLVADLIVALGFLFLMINVGLELAYLRIDPRLRDTLGAAEQREDIPTWRERWNNLANRVSDFINRLAEWRRAFVPRLSRDPKLKLLTVTVSEANAAASSQLPPTHRAWRTLKIIFGNVPLLMGTVMVAGLIALALYGDRLTPANPYATHGTTEVEGKIGSPPFAPSSVFPWGTDPVGRDIQALVLAGARQTLELALLAMAARLLVGALLGVLAGWARNSWLDKLITGAVAVWAAFPVTLFAMILILALGIQQGMWVFIVALCLVGWGEVAQLVRAQIIGIKPQPYIEAARAIGARSGRILTRHVLPHLASSLLVVAVLEMGGILMLLAELGFLNIFLGGGFKVEIADTGRTSTTYFFSDVPEWGAQLANIRNWWRSYPWLAWYPGIFFFLAILSFNLWGEGLRRFLDESRLNISRIFSRTMVVAFAALAIGVFAVVQSNAPLELYRGEAMKFEAARALQDIRALASPDMQGRETGTPGAQLAAEYIARQMKEAGLFPAGENDTFFQTTPSPRFHLTDAPRLEILNNADRSDPFTYRRDFVEYVTAFPTYGESEGAIVGVALGPDPSTNVSDPFGLSNLGLRDKIIIVRDTDITRVNLRAAAGVLLVTDDTAPFQHKYLFPSEAGLNPFTRSRAPVMYISAGTANKLLATAGSTLAQLDEAATNLQAGKTALTATGATVRISISGTLTDDLNEKYYQVIGYLPGTAALTAGTSGSPLDSHVIMVSAYYDGLGIGPDETLYPGANDNASGVAAMLELARELKISPYQPKRTVVFVAWSGGERGESLSVSNIMNARVGFPQLTVEAVLELSGVGAGSGNAMELAQGSSFKLVQLFQSAADRMGVATTTRGRGPHFGLFARNSFGGRTALTTYLSWDGSDNAAHTSSDTVESIDPAKLQKFGETTLLVLSVITREVDY